MHRFDLRCRNSALFHLARPIREAQSENQKRQQEQISGRLFGRRGQGLSEASYAHAEHTATPAAGVVLLTIYQTALVTLVQIHEILTPPMDQLAGV